MKRKPIPHEELVMEIRHQITSQSLSAISDDSDQWCVGALGYSPMLRQGEYNKEKRDKAAEAAAQLLEIGEGAAEAVALGLRMPGRWREYLLPFAQTYRDVSEIHEALTLVAARKRDPLTFSATRILKGQEIKTER